VIDSGCLVPVGRQSQAEVWAFLFFAATDAGEYQVFMQVDPPLFKGDQVA